MSSNGDEIVEDPDKGERKRQREKQRRSDLANAFDELQLTLNRIEHGTDVYGRPVKVELNTETPVTRLGLVLQTTEALQRLYQENVHMRMSLGGQWIQDESVTRPQYRTDHGHALYPPPQSASYYQGHGGATYTDAYHSLYPSSASSAPSYNGYHQMDAWDRRGGQEQDRQHTLYQEAASALEQAPVQNGAGYNGANRKSSV
ncbi:hypothetical protein MPSEU_000466900 [Mayamaea pseudoterrestris]|nr:hypothetical protein MPSEU_000466900 [Mayamaea pseudoterrestris]